MVGASHIDIGPPQIDSMKGGDIANMVKLPMNKDFFWSTFFQGIGFGDKLANAFTFKDGYPYTITDSGSSHLFVPEEFFEIIVVKIMEAAGNPQYQISEGIVLCTCATTFKPLYIMFNSYWL